MSWQSFGLVNGQVQIMPVADLREHDASSDCWCQPFRDADNERIVIHNSMDGREEYERGEKRLG